MYVLERFLFRLAASAYRDRLVLKGGMLLAALGSRRPTADIDLLAEALSNDTSKKWPASSGRCLRSGWTTASPTSARCRVRGSSGTPSCTQGFAWPYLFHLARARAVLRVDVNVGDPVTPGPVEVEYPSLLEGSFRLLGYPLATVLAEKVVTMVDRGTASDRERDFADVVLLARRHAVDAGELRAALRATAAYRGSTLWPLAGQLDQLAAERQSSSGRLPRPKRPR